MATEDIDIFESQSPFRTEGLREYALNPEEFMSEDRQRQRFGEAFNELRNLVDSGQIDLDEIPFYQDQLDEMSRQGMPPRAKSYLTPYTFPEADFIADYMSYGRELSPLELQERHIQAVEDAVGGYESQVEDLQRKSGIQSLLEGFQRRTSTDYPTMGTTTVNLFRETDEMPAFNLFRSQGMGSDPSTVGLEVKRTFYGRRPKAKAKSQD